MRGTVDVRRALLARPETWTIASARVPPREALLESSNVEVRRERS
jgi:hypothetical protein